MSRMRVLNIELSMFLHISANLLLLAKHLKLPPNHFPKHILNIWTDKCVFLTFRQQQFHFKSPNEGYWRLESVRLAKCSFNAIIARSGINYFIILRKHAFWDEVHASMQRWHLDSSTRLQDWKVWHGDNIQSSPHHLGSTDECALLIMLRSLSRDKWSLCLEKSAFCLLEKTRFLWENNFKWIFFLSQTQSSSKQKC